MLRSLDDLRGYAIHATDGEIGVVDDLYFDDASWTIRYLVVNTGPWLFGRKVLISPLAVGEPDWVGRVLPVNLTQEQVENSPDIDLEQPVSRQQQEALHAHYGWDYYWLSMQATTSYGGGPKVPPQPKEQPPQPTPEETPSPRPRDAHLRSVDEVLGYHIQAIDGEVGHVEDFVAEDTSWIIRYMVVDTRNWLPGRDVLVAPQWIEAVDWVEAKVHVDMHQESIKNSPEFDPSAPVNREYESRLYDYYGRPVYWDRE